VEVEGDIPDPGYVKPGGWGASADANTWKIVNMKDTPTLFKIVDSAGKNVAVNFRAQAGAQAYIDSHKGGGGPPPPPPPPPPGPAGAIPVPTGFATTGKVSNNFVFWGRTTTNYASGGSGPSLRWDNEDIQSTQVLAGYEFNLGTKHGSRGDDNIDLKCRGNSHSDGKGGWYLPWISWHGDGKPGETGCGKEYPHPSTTHDPWNVEDKKANVGNIKDGNWHAFLVAVYNDKKGVPTMQAWFNPTASGKMADYVYLGKSKDTGNMKPGPVLTKIAQQGGGKQSLQIRMDEVPDAKVRNTFAVELSDTPE
jgi:hypothetical protein